MTSQFSIFFRSFPQHQHSKTMHMLYTYENEFDQAVRIFHPYDNDFYHFLIKTLNVFKMRFHETNCLNSRVLRIVELKLINQTLINDLTFLLFSQFI